MRWDQDWLRGTRLMSGKIVIVNDCCDDNLIERVKKEIDTTVKWCRSDLSRIRVTIESLDNED